MWPQAVFEERPLSEFDPDALVRLDRDGDYSELLAFARDAEMDKFWTEHGYAVMPDGEGPFGVFYRRQPYLSWEVEVVRAHDAWTGYVSESGDRRRLVAKDAVTMSVVTPADPHEHAFSRKVVDLVLSCLA